MTLATEEGSGWRTALRRFLEETFSSNDESKLPQRVQEQLNRRRARSEVLIKVIQLGVFVLWAILYFLSPKTDTGTDFSPVPYALTAYLVLNVIGLIWALQRYLPDWAVYINVLIDMGMLMILIWSFHIQYEQPASFYLKAPTMLYIFIFIALRALRFEPRFVVAMGIAGAAGWIGLTAYGVLATAEDNMITRDYVEYLTSNSILLGAEIDKVIVILMVTLILALSLKRAQTTLIRAVTEGTAARDLSRFFDAGVAERIRDAQTEMSAGEGVWRDAAIVFVDIRGFTTSTADMEPDAVMSMLTAYQKRIVPIIQMHGGVIDKFLGDGIMASFGAISENETFAADALNAVDAIIAESERWAEEEGPLKALAAPRINAAVASGGLVFGALGDEKRLEFTTIGATVNLAAKLEKHNKEIGSRAICDLDTFEMAKKQSYSPRNVRQVSETIDGVSRSIDLVILH